MVFEILSPGNTRAEMDRKRLFYDRYGVEEYYIYDPDHNRFEVWLRRGAHLVLSQLTHWISPRLGIRFCRTEDTLKIHQPNQQRFLPYTELAQRVEAEQQRAEAERQRANQAEQTIREAIPRLMNLGLTAEQIAEALSLPVEFVEATIQAR